MFILVVEWLVKLAVVGGIGISEVGKDGGLEIEEMCGGRKKEIEGKRN